MRVDVLEFDSNGTMKLCVNGERLSSCSLKNVDRRCYLLSDYLLCYHLDRLKKNRIDLFKKPLSMQELEEIAHKIGIEILWTGDDRILAIQHHT